MRTGRVIIARYREDCPTERATSPKQCPSSLCLSCLWPNKASNILSMEFSNAFHLTIMLHLTMSRFLIKSTCFFYFFYFFQALIYFSSWKHIMQRINAPASRERILDSQFLPYVSTIICCIKTVRLISIRFTGIDQLHILYTYTKVYANWMSASS